VVRIGMVNYINTAPIYEEWKAMSIDPAWQVTTAPPSTLNRLLAADELDLGMVSCYEYAARPDKYRILADLSISANGPVGSVFLFSSVPPEELTDKLVLLTGQSATSVALVKIVLEEFFKIQPRYAVGDILNTENDAGNVQAILAIGDDALRLDLQNDYQHKLDLAEVWRKNTGLPFVFAVFAVREEFVNAHPETLKAVQQTLINCRENGRKHLFDICRNVAPRIPMKVDSCYDYLQKIQHNLGLKHQQALEKFFSLLIERGEVDNKALPLKFFPDESLSSI
jgi:chorismate dehydratase